MNVEADWPQRLYWRKIASEDIIDHVLALQGRMWPPTRLSVDQDMNELVHRQLIEDVFENDDETKINR